MSENLVTSIIVIIGGVFSIIASILNWNWFFENRKARLFVTLFSRQGARIFYIILGIGLIYLGIRIY